MAGTVKKLQFSEGTDVGAPSDLSLQTSTSVIKAYADDAAYVSGEGAAQEGSVYLNSTTKKFRMYIGSAWRNAVPESDGSDATKKFLVDMTGATTGFSGTLTFAQTGDRVYTFPDTTMTVAGRANSETLSNKTLASPLVSGGSIDATAAGNFALLASVGANNLDVGGSSTNVRILGNVEVLGTTTTISTASLDVTDANIMVNVGGNDLSSEGAGLEVDRTSTHGSFVFDSTLSSKWKAGLLASENEIVDVATEQTMIKKRLHLHTVSAADDSTSPRIVLPQNTLTNLQAITSGNHPNEGAVYWATDANAAYVWDGSSLQPIAPSSSGSGVNYIGTSDFEGNNVSGWSTYADAAGTSPVDGTGGTASSTFAATTSGVLRGSFSAIWTKSAADRQGEGFSYDFTIAAADRGKYLPISAALSTSANYVTGDMGVFIYDVTNTALISVADSNIVAGKNFGGFFKSSSTSSSYRLIFHTKTTSALAYTVLVDDVRVGDNATIRGDLTLPYQNYTPTITMSAGSFSLGNGTLQGNYKLVGADQIHLQIRLLAGSTTTFGTAGASFGFSLPSGFTVDTSKLFTGAQQLINTCGQFMVYDSGGNIYTGNSYWDTTNSQLRAAYWTLATYVIVNDVFKNNGPITLATSDEIYLTAILPVLMS